MNHSGKSESTESGWWYLSFATDEGFRGGVVVEAHDVISAVQEAWRKKINPGGQVLGAPIPSDKLPAEPFRNRLLDKAACDACWDDCVRLGDVRDGLDDDKLEAATVEQGETDTSSDVRKPTEG